METATYFPFTLFLNPWLGECSGFEHKADAAQATQKWREDWQVDADEISDVTFLRHLTTADGKARALYASDRRCGTRNHDIMRHYFVATVDTDGFYDGKVFWLRRIGTRLLYSPSLCGKPYCRSSRYFRFTTRQIAA